MGHLMTMFQTVSHQMLVQMKLYDFQPQHPGGDFCTFSTCSQHQMAVHEGSLGSSPPFFTLSFSPSNWVVISIEILFIRIIQLERLRWNRKQCFNRQVVCHQGCTCLAILTNFHIFENIFGNFQCEMSVVRYTYFLQFTLMTILAIFMKKYIGKFTYRFLIYQQIIWFMIIF